MMNSTLEAKIVEYCAPTLAGMKSAGLFSYFYVDRAKAEEELGAANVLLNERGVYVVALLWRERSVLVYAYRKRLLQRELSDEKTRALLTNYGYAGFDVASCIGHLKRRLCETADFPHEIGIFLGYPLEDVKGFIENGGKNCIGCGMWKVYCNVCEKQKLFDKYKRCTQVYMQVFGEGRRLSQMTVAG